MKPYYQDEFVTLYNCDWRDHAELAIDAHADLIVTDPPYGETSLEWDKWPDRWPIHAADLELAPAMWCFGSMRMFMDRAAEFEPWTLSQDVVGAGEETAEGVVVWEKHNGSSFHTDRFKRVHEFATHWYRGAWGDVYHEVPTTLDATPRTVRRKARPKHTGHIEASSYQSFNGGPRIMRSVLYAPSLHGKAINETQKPEPLCQLLIGYGCVPGGTVLDLFAGSCSTLVAARATGRRAVGFEVRESQCYEAAKRLQQDDMFGGVPA